MKNQITKGEWVVRGVDRVDEKKRQIWFRAGGIYPDQDPYYIHYCRVNFDGTGLTWLTDGDGTHAVEYSPDRRFLIDTYSRVDMPPVTELRRVEDGKLVCNLEQADMTGPAGDRLEAAGAVRRQGPRRQDGYLRLIYRPMRLRPREEISGDRGHLRRAAGLLRAEGFAPYYGDQSLAELGFIVVQIDGMGTRTAPRRSTTSAGRTSATPASRTASSG